MPEAERSGSNERATNGKVRRATYALRWMAVAQADQGRSKDVINE
jgi:hypothetical protein